MDKKRICMTIDLDALQNNLSIIRSCLQKETKLLAVIKCDAYGHGAVPIARFLEANKLADGYALATADEALELREAGIRGLLLVLGYTDPAQYPEMIRQNIRPTLYSAAMARAFASAASETGKEGIFHIKVDTGMGRIGLPCNGDGISEIEAMTSLPGIRAEGIFTHFARADEENKEAAMAQYVRFSEFLSSLEERGMTFSLRHCANSAAILEMPQTDLDAVRAGIILYGLWPSEEISQRFALRPVMSLHSTVVHLKTVPAGTSVGYGGTWTAPRESRIATVPVGYGDGYARALSNRGSVLIRGRRAPIVGRVCMDQMMVDVTDVPGVRLADPVTLLGKDGDGQITLEELGDLSGRFNYEFACDLGTRRIPHRFCLGGRVVDQLERLGLNPPENPRAPRR